MAPYTYYFLFTLAGVLLVPAAVFNAKFALDHGKTIVGEKVTSGAPGYKKIKWLTSAKGLVIVSFVEIFLIANLVNSVRLINALNYSSKAGIFLLGPIGIIAIFIGVLRAMANRAK